jgi:hypothetical protein
MHRKGKKPALRLVWSADWNDTTHQEVISRERSQGQLPTHQAVNLHDLTKGTLSVFHRLYANTEMPGLMHKIRLPAKVNPARRLGDYPNADFTDGFPQITYDASLLGKLLENTPASLQKIMSTQHMLGYMSLRLLTAKTTFDKHVAERFKPDEASLAATYRWRFAGGLALQAIDARLKVNDTMVASMRETYREMQQQRLVEHNLTMAIPRVYDVSTTDMVLPLKPHETGLLLPMNQETVQHILQDITE